MDSRFDPPLTIADLEATPDDGKRYELIEGQLYVSDSAYYTHQTVLVNIAFAVCEYLRTRPIGEIVPGIAVILDDSTSVTPDLLFFTNRTKKSHPIGRGADRGPGYSHRDSVSRRLERAARQANQAETLFHPWCARVLDRRSRGPQRGTVPEAQTERPHSGHETPDRGRTHIHFPRRLPAAAKGDF